jgi:hypothetical protein
MSIDERLRSGLSANAQQLAPALDTELSAVLGRADRRRSVRTALVGVGAGAAALVAGAMWLSGASVDRSEAPGPSHDDVRVEEPVPMAGINGPLEAGTYVMPMWGRNPDALPRAMVEVPDGYGSPGGWVVDRGADGHPEEFGSVGFWTVDKTPVDPCDGAGKAVDPGPSVRDLVDALRAQPGQVTTVPRPVSVDGRRGLYLEVRLPADANVLACFESMRRLWLTGEESYAQGGPGTLDRLWVLSVDGHRVVMAVQSTPTESPQDVADLLAIAESTRFLGPEPSSG